MSGCNNSHHRGCLIGKKLFVSLFFTIRVLCISSPEVTKHYYYRLNLIDIWYLFDFTDEVVKLLHSLLKIILLFFQSIEFISTEIKNMCW